MDNIHYIQDYLSKERQMLEGLSEEQISRVMDAFMRVYEQEGTIYIFGNGGSSCTASHLANDFNKGASGSAEKKFRVCCLNDNTATLMSIANDIAYEEVFRYQLQGRLRPEDLVVGISGSGNSPNVINAVSYANEQGVQTVGFCGFDGGALAKTADVVFHVDVNNMQLVEDGHMIMVHLLMNAFYHELSGI